MKNLTLLSVCLVGLLLAVPAQAEASGGGSFNCVNGVPVFIPAPQVVNVGFNFGGFRGVAVDAPVFVPARQQFLFRQELALPRQEVIQQREVERGFLGRKRVKETTIIR